MTARDTHRPRRCVQATESLSRSKHFPRGNGSTAFPLPPCLPSWPPRGILSPRTWEKTKLPCCGHWAGRSNLVLRQQDMLQARHHTPVTPKRFSKGVPPSPRTRYNMVTSHGAEVKNKAFLQITSFFPVNYFYSKNSCYVNPPTSEKELHISKNSTLLLITQNHLGLGSGARGGEGWGAGETQVD